MPSASREGDPTFSKVELSSTVTFTIRVDLSFPDMKIATIWDKLRGDAPESLMFVRPKRATYLDFATRSGLWSAIPRSITDRKIY